MIELLYQTDSYLREFSATVVAVDSQERALAPERTAFYPGGGGQPCDTGALVLDDVAMAVTQTRRQGRRACAGTGVGLARRVTPANPKP